MKSRLKNLYKYLVENRIHELKAWHDAYSNFYEQISQLRKKLNYGKNLSYSDDTDKALLKRLLYDKNNGIASRGQSVLSKENFELFIKNKEFISALENFIKTPDKENYKKFENAWSAQDKSKNPVLINRVAAASTLEVCTTVDNDKFNQVFDWLINEEIIPPYPAKEDQDWFSKNNYLLRILKNSFKKELQSNQAHTNDKIDAFYLSQFIWLLYENLSNPFHLKKQIIKYGAPGTGKTYTACQQASLFFNNWKDAFAPNESFTFENQSQLVQFHPSFSYEDFIEGLRPVLNNDGTVQLTLQNGIFKQFCCNAGQWEMDVCTLGLAQDWDSLTIEKLRPYKEKLTGKYWQYIFENSDSSKLIADAVPPFFFIIDEVNRAELSHVFGELMYCLEYRGIKGKVKTQYANLNNKHTGMIKTLQGYQFFIPSNIYIIGTMNTIDRSVESFDFALRRRFHWQEVMPDIGILRYHLNQYYKNWATLADNLEQLNIKITENPLLGPVFQIGHAYLMNLKYASSLTVAEVRSQIWSDSIRPLLQEYLRGTGQEVELLNVFSKTFGV